MKLFKPVVLMRSILFLSIPFLMCVTLAFHSFEPGKNDLESENINGRVKTVISYVNETADQSHNGKASSFKYITNYNMRGNATEIYMYDISTKEKLFLSWIYGYDAQGRKISTSNKSGDVMGTYSYSYNLEHNLIETFYHGGQVSLYIVYNNRGARDSTFLYDMAGKLTGRAIYRYDEMGNLTEEAWYKPDGISDYKMLYKYDNKHNKLQKTRYTANGKKDSWTAFKYDEKGNVIMQTDSNILYIRGIREIPPINNADLNSNDRTYSYSVFDKADNWLQKQEMANGTVVRITKRKIEYY